MPENYEKYIENENRVLDEVLLKYGEKYHGTDPVEDL